jgi:hypothetical protein
MREKRFFLAELKRRDVHKVAGAWAAAIMIGILFPTASHGKG